MSKEFSKNLQATIACRFKKYEAKWENSHSESRYLHKSGFT